MYNDGNAYVFKANSGNPYSDGMSSFHGSYDFGFKINVANTSTSLVFDNDNSVIDITSDTVNINGDLNITGSCSGCSSDIRLKTAMEPLHDSLGKISSLRGIRYEWKEDTKQFENFPDRQIGVVAQEVERVFPEIVGVDSKGYKYVDYQKLVVPLIESVKELKAENEALKQILCELKPDAEICP